METMNKDWLNKVESSAKAILVKAETHRTNDVELDVKAIRVLCLRLYELAFLPEHLHGTEEVFAEHFE